MIEAHARFDATKRTYEYHIHTKKDVFESDNSWYYQHDLNVDKMNEACKILFNYIDFECFSKVHTDVNTFNCTIFEANWTQVENQISFYNFSRSFFEKYGSSNCWNNDKYWIRKNIFDMILIKLLKVKTEIKQDFQFQHMDCI